MKIVLATIAGLALMVGTATLSAQETSTGEIEWIDISKAFELAPETGKIVLIDFYTDWCGWCKRMDKTTYSDSTVVAYISERFHATKVNPEKSGEIKLMDETYSPRQFAQGMQVRGYPATCLIIHEEGEEKPIAVPLRAGYIAADQMMLYLRFYGENAYKTMTFQEFVASADTPGGTN